MGRKVPGLQCCIRNRAQAGLAADVSQAFIIAEEEGPILFNWTTTGSAELIPIVRRCNELSLFVDEIGIALKQISRLHHVVPVELVKRTVELVGSGLGNCVDLPAAALAELGGIIT